MHIFFDEHIVTFDSLCLICGVGGCLNNYLATTPTYRRKRIIQTEMPPLITKITNKNAILLLLPKFIIQIYCVVIKLGVRSAGLNIQYRFATRRIVN